ncbi:hypothetical protein G6L37_34780 [Agrobacterium rubi]|nr:hypothetical protein [Agrobacterium rubi]NTF23734.1 hypothetical protein [Agrobacterium rubi]
MTNAAEIVSPDNAPNTDVAVAAASSRPTVAVQTMRMSDGRADYYVSIKVGDRQVHPHMFREEYKAAYHVALYEWLFNGSGEEPDLMAFDEGDWPAQTTVLVGADPAEIDALEKRVAELEEELDEALQAPWPAWADSILKSFKAHGYDPKDCDGAIDLGEAFEDYLDGIAQSEDSLRKVIAAKDEEIASLVAAMAASKGSNND